uniref:Uncharacterized protein n=1 Tax=Siphoviridae sp. ctaDn21 TaxID=2825563 RepID=A0A8S5UV02_9CAUD|nr:MAG TPA: hypothetical protein [Siphoviridae sp. ctaDn21]
MMSFPWCYLLRLSKKNKKKVQFFRANGLRITR